jgi:hypothetical protein
MMEREQVSETLPFNSPLPEKVLVHSFAIFNFYITGPSDESCDISDPGNTLHTDKIN